MEREGHNRGPPGHGQAAASVASYGAQAACQGQSCVQEYLGKAKGNDKKGGFPPAHNLGLLNWDYTKLKSLLDAKVLQKPPTSVMGN